MVIAETMDLKYIRDAVTDPYVWRWASDDSSPRIYLPPIGDGVIWVRAGDFGVFMVQELVGAEEYEVHAALNRSARGEAVDISRKALAWLYTRLTKPYTLVANIPEHNRLAVRLANELGFTKVGAVCSPYVKAGKIYRRDKYIYRQEV